MYKYWIYKSYQNATRVLWPGQTLVGGLPVSYDLGSRVVISTAAFHARVRRFARNKMFLPHPRVKRSIVGSLCDREVACSASDRQRFEFCVWRTVSSHSSHHPQEVLLAQFSLFVRKGDLKPDSFHFFGHDEYIAFSIDFLGHRFPRCRLPDWLEDVTNVLVPPISPNSKTWMLNHLSS